MAECEDTDEHLLPSEQLERAQKAITAVTHEAARRGADREPGLVQALEQVVIYVAPGPRSALGWFSVQRPWSAAGRTMHEIVLNADHLDRSAEELLVTCLHETVHAHAALQQVQDVSRQGRYHNKTFARFAEAIGLAVATHPVIGHVTVGLSSAGWELYGDLVDRLACEVGICRRAAGPRGEGGRGGGSRSGGRGAGGGGGTEPSSEGESAWSRRRYVSAVCDCLSGRGERSRVRIPRADWPRRILCQQCGQALVEEPEVAPPPAPR